MKLIGREEHAPLSPVIVIDPPLTEEVRGGNQTYEDLTFETAAEVINLERNILITGDHDDFEETKVGLHTMGGYDGNFRVSYTRLEWCGQEGTGTGGLGQYCLHMHHLSHCPECLIEGNAIEHVLKAGINIHDTHDALVHRNVVYSTNKGVGSYYVEDGNGAPHSIQTPRAGRTHAHLSRAVHPHASLPRSLLAERVPLPLVTAPMRVNLAASWLSGLQPHRPQRSTTR